MLPGDIRASHNRIDILIAEPGCEARLRLPERNHGNLHFAHCLEGDGITSVHGDVPIHIGAHGAEPLHQLPGGLQICCNEFDGVSAWVGNRGVDGGNLLRDHLFQVFRFCEELFGFEGWEVLRKVPRWELVGHSISIDFVDDVHRHSVHRVNSATWKQWR